MVEYALSNILLPGQIESWNIIFDLNNFGIFEMPLSKIQDVAVYLIKNYKCRLFKCFVVSIYIYLIEFRCYIIFVNYLELYESSIAVINN